MLAASVLAAIVRVASVPAAIARVATALVHIVVLAAIVVTLATVAVMAGMAGVVRVGASGLRLQGLRPLGPPLMVLTMHDAATIPIHHATSLTTKSPKKSPISRPRAVYEHPWLPWLRRGTCDEDEEFISRPDGSKG